LAKELNRSVNEMGMPLAGINPSDYPDEHNVVRDTQLPPERLTRDLRIEFRGIHGVQNGRRLVPGRTAAEPLPNGLRVTHDACGQSSTEPVNVPHTSIQEIPRMPDDRNSFEPTDDPGTHVGLRPVRVQ